MASDVVKQAVATGRYHREVYVAAPEGPVLVEGFIDLVFETDEGLVVVDYKTDGVETPEEIFVQIWRVDPISIDSGCLWLLCKAIDDGMPEWAEPLFDLIAVQ